MSPPKTCIDYLLAAASTAAAYTKSQLYVTLQHSHGSHFIDHSLRSVLESALMPDDNDLFVTNVAGMPLLALHGCVSLLPRSCSRSYLHSPRGSDMNVPVWHSRALLATLKTWYPETSATYVQSPFNHSIFMSLFIAYTKFPVVTTGGTTYCRTPRSRHSSTTISALEFRPPIQCYPRPSP